MYLTCIFPVRDITAFSNLGTLDFSAMLRGQIKQQNHQQKAQDCKTLLQSTKTRREIVTLLTLVYACQVTQVFHCSEHAHTHT